MAINLLYKELIKNLSILQPLSLLMGALGTDESLSNAVDSVGQSVKMNRLKLVYGKTF